MVEPVTVFLVAVACLLIGGSAAGPLAARTGVPEAVWLVGFGALLRVSGAASPEAIAALAPFFAALALIIVLFEAGRDLRVGGATGGRARLLALVGALLTLLGVTLFSQALSGLHLLPTWSWTHALMLGSLMLCTAPEVFTPALRRLGATDGLVATLEREAALTGALAITTTATCIDLLSTRIPEGQAAATIAAGFGLGAAFGSFAGLLWIAAVRRLGPSRGVYPYTLAGLVLLYVVTEALGGIGALAVLVFGAIVANAATLVAVLFRPRGEAVEGDTEGEDFAAALADHGRTVSILRVLLFTFIGLGLGPLGGLLAMGVVLGILLAVMRLLAVRLVCRGVSDRELALLGSAWPRGMLVAGLAALPHAAAVPGTAGLTTLVFSAVATSCVVFAAALRHQPAERAAKEPEKPAPVRVAPVRVAPAAGPPAGGRASEAVAAVAAPADEGPPGEPEQVAAQPRRTLDRTEIRVPTVEEVLAPTIASKSAERTAIRGSGPGMPRAVAQVVAGEDGEAAVVVVGSPEGGSEGPEVAAAKAASSPVTEPAVPPEDEAAAAAVAIDSPAATTSLER